MLPNIKISTPFVAKKRNFKIASSSSVECLGGWCELSVVTLVDDRFMRGSPKLIESTQMRIYSRHLSNTFLLTPEKLFGWSRPIVSHVKTT